MRNRPRGLAPPGLLRKDSGLVDAPGRRVVRLALFWGCRDRADHRASAVSHRGSRATRWAVRLPRWPLWNGIAGPRSCQDVRWRRRGILRRIAYLGTLAGVGVSLIE